MLLLAILAMLVGIIRVERLQAHWRARDRTLEEMSRRGPHRMEAYVTDVLSDRAGRVRLVVDDVTLERWGTRISLDGALDLRPAPDSLLSSVRPGEWIASHVRVAPLRGPNLPGGFDARTYFYTEGVVGRAFGVADSEEILRNDAMRDPGVLTSWWSWWRRRSASAVALFADRLPAEEADLVSALIVGRRGLLSGEQRQVFVDSGLVHVTAISGLHTTLWLLSVHWLLRKTGVRRRPMAWLTPVLLMAFVGLVGARVPTVRAVLMAGVLAGGLLLSRPVDHLTSLATALLLVLVFQPAQAWGVSLQLSFAAIAALMLLAPNVTGVPVGACTGRLHRLARRLARFVKLSLIASCVVTFALAPLLLYHFGQFAPVAVIANLLAIPILWVLLLSAYLWLAVAGIGLDWLADPLGWLTGQFASWLIAVASWAASIPGGHVAVHGMAPPLLLAVLALFAILAVRGWRVRENSPCRYPRLVVVLGALAVGVVVANLWDHLAPARIDFLSLGQGDATLLRSRQGAVVLVDGGPAPLSGSDPAPQPALMRYLEDQGISRIDLMVLTHPEDDHIGALTEVVEAIPIKLLVTSGFLKETRAHARFRETVQRLGIPTRTVQMGDRIAGIPGISLRVLHPQPGVAAVEAAGNVNENSVVLLASMEGTDILLTGDIGHPTERRLAAHGLVPDVVALKVPHHGSRHSSSWELLNAARPEVAVIEVGRNSHGHPTPETLKRLYGSGVQVLRTDRDGSVRLILGRGSGPCVWTTQRASFFTLLPAGRGGIQTAAG